MIYYCHKESGKRRVDGYTTIVFGVGRAPLVFKYRNYLSLPPELRRFIVYCGDV